MGNGKILLLSDISVYIQALCSSRKTKVVCQFCVNWIGILSCLIHGIISQQLGGEVRVGSWSSLVADPRFDLHPHLVTHPQWVGGLQREIPAKQHTHKFISKPLFTASCTTGAANTHTHTHTHTTHIRDIVLCCYL